MASEIRDPLLCDATKSWKDAEQGAVRVPVSSYCPLSNPSLALVRMELDERVVRDHGL